MFRPALRRDFRGLCASAYSPASRRIPRVLLALGLMLFTITSSSRGGGQHASAWLYATNTVAGSTEVNLASATSLLWHTGRVDTTCFHAVSHTNRLTVKRAGDYLLAVTLPISSSHSVDNDRSCIQTEIHVSRSGIDSVVEGATGESSYLRLGNYHQQSSDHIAVLATNLSAGDYMEVKVRGTAKRVAAVNMERASWYVEHMPPERTAFSATTAGNAAGNLQTTSASALLWDTGRANAAFSHTSGDTDLTLKEAGDYLVFVNIPLAGDGTTARQAPKLLVTLNGTTVPGGEGRQGYLRQNGEGNDYASLHWSGLVRSTGANQTLVLQTIRESTAGGAVTVRPGRVGSLFIEKVDTSEDTFYGRGTTLEGGTANWNPSPAKSVEWSTDEIVDTNCFAHSTVAASHQVTIRRAGHYLLVYNDNLKETGTQRVNPIITVTVDGVARPGAQTKCHYIRQNSGHQESSGTLVYLLTDLTNGSLLEVSVSQDRQSGAVDDGATANLLLWRRPWDDPELPLIEHADTASGVTSSNAWLAATVTSTGTAPTRVWAHWGPTDAGTNLSWAFTNDLGVTTGTPPLRYNVNATGLVADTVYYYRFRAANSNGTSWAENRGSFMTGCLRVEATDPLASEEGPDAGTFLISRPPTLTSDSLTVNYHLGGTASNGIDYARLSGTAVIAPGQSNVTITVTPWDDIRSGESTETLKLSLLPGGYVLGSLATAMVEIADNDLSPEQIPDLRLWLDAGTGVATAGGAPPGDGGAVSTWHDRSGMSNVANQATADMRPIYAASGLNGQPMVRFTGTSTMAVTHSSFLDAGIAQTVFTVFLYDAGSSVAFKGAAPGMGVGEWRMTPAAYGASGVQPGGLAMPNSGEIRLVTGRYTGSGIEVFHNRAFQGEVLQSGVITNARPLIVGDTLAGGIGQIIVYNRALSDTERHAVETYLLGEYFGAIMFAGVEAPHTATVLDPFHVSADITPLVTLTDSAATLWYREGTSGTFTAIAMVNTTGHTYTTSTPIPRGSATTVQYYIEVTYIGAESGSATWPFAGDAAPATLTRADADDRQSGPSRRRTGLTVSEVMYHPPDPYGSEMEFLELVNTEPVPLDISGYRLSGEIDYTFPNGTTIGGHERLVVAHNPAFVASFYGLSGVMGTYSKRLSDGGGTVRLRNRHNAVLLEFAYSDGHPWPVQADGGGHSLVLARPDLGEEDVNAWEASAARYGNPGTANPTVDDPMQAIVVNEALMHTDQPQIDFVELHNHSTQAVDISRGVLTDDPNAHKFIIPPGTTLSPGSYLSFDQTTLGFSLSMHGDPVYFINTNANRVVDAVLFPAQTNGLSTGRYPDGSPLFRVLATPTPGTSNSVPTPRDVVINEIMYHPISGDEDDEYIELHNRSRAAVDLSYWRLIEGVSFTFPTGTMIEAGGHLVVARNAARLIARYPQLDTTNTFGDFSGRLSDNGERVVLACPDDPESAPDQDFVVMDTVVYGDGKAWGEWADGGGSSLELVDPHSDNRYAMNWAGSDETIKAAWTTIAVTGIVRAAVDGLNSEGTIILDEFHVYMLHEGECLLDDFSLVSTAGGGVARAQDDFEGDLSKWQLLGNHKRTSIDTDDAYGGTQSLRVRSSGAGDSIHADDQRPPPFYNRLVTTVSPTLTDGEEAVIHARVRWLRGDPYVVLVVKAFALEAVGELPLPDNLGTPGQQNSVYRSNAGPAIGSVAHAPVLPTNREPVVVSCRVDDPDGIDAVELRYRVDPNGTNTGVTMNDNGTGGDIFAGDGLYSATIPGQPSGTLVAFHVVGSDATGPTTNTFPSDAPARECLVRFGDPPAAGDFQTYRIWMTAAKITEWEDRHARDNEVLDCTLVYGNDRAIYNAGARYRGNFRSFNGPTGSQKCAYLFMTPKSDLVLGENEVKIDQCGQNGTDTTRQREHTAYWIGEQMGLPSSYLRFIQVRVNHSDRGIMHDFQPPTRDLAKSWFEDDDPPIYRIMTNRGLDIHLLPDGTKNKARYRVSWQKKVLDYPNDDYTPIYQVADVLNLPDTDAFIAGTEALVDVDQWLGVVAFNHVIINSDAFGYNFRHNAYSYLPAYGCMRIFFADLDNGLHPNDTPTASLFTTSDDPYTDDMLAVPAFRRVYWRHLRHAALGPLDADNVNPLVDAWYAAFRANGVSLDSPDALKTRLAGRRAYILSQLATVDSVFQITTSGGFRTGQRIITMSGTAPIDVESVTVNGTAQPVNFTDLNTWHARVELEPGDNTITIVGLDANGQTVASDTIAVTYLGSTLSPEGLLVINEIMYNPQKVNAEFVELHNLSQTESLNLEGIRLNGIDFTFDPGTFIGPTSYVVVAESIPAYAAAYSNAEVVAGECAGSLDNGGETLSIQMPLTSNTWRTIDSVRYGNTLPWPPEADIGGYSLQLIDPSRDNSLVGNWATGGGVLSTPGQPNSVRQSLPAIPNITINEIQPRNGGTLPDNAGDFDPWAELYQGATTFTNLNGFYLTDDTADLTRWAFPFNAPIDSNSFVLVWTDGEPGEATTTNLHTSFAMNSNTGSLTLVWVHGSTTTILDHVDYDNVAAYRSYGRHPDGDVTRPRIVCYYPTPGITNNPTVPPAPIFINEWMADNNSTILDPADARYEDWIEIYNAGSSAANLAGYTLTDNTAVPGKWVFPTGTVIAAKGFLFVWADGDPHQTGGGSYHADFSLNRNGEEIAVYTPDGILADSFTFSTQSADISQGRWPNGHAQAYHMGTPTPAASNIAATLVVSSPRGTPTPPRGTNVCDHNTPVTCSLAGSPETGPGIFSECLGWAGSGSVPTSGAETVVNVTMTEPSTLTWEWATRVELSVSAGPNGSVNSTGGWYSVGTTGVAVNATANPGYAFASWAGDVPPTQADHPSLLLTIDAPRGLTAGFAAIHGTYTIIAAAGPRGTIAPSGTVHVAGLQDQAFVMTPETGYGVATVTVDGMLVPPTPVYTFTAVSTNHTIAVTFEWSRPGTVFIVR